MSYNHQCRGGRKQFSYCSDIGIIQLLLSVVAYLGKGFPSYFAKDVNK